MSATGKKGVKRTLDRKTIEFKYQALQEVEKGTKTKTQIAKDLEISHSTLATWVKNAASIKEGYLNFGPKRKLMKTGKWDELENALLKWFTNARESGAVVTGAVLMHKADEFAAKLEISDFEAKMGWLTRFKDRHSISFKAICGESKSVETDSDAMAEWKTKLSNILQKYSADDIYNADETGMFYKMLPEKTYKFKNVDCNGGKRSKDRLTVLVCANMSGTHKLPLLVIGKSAKPRCFKNVKTLPTTYTSNKRAWMTSDIFKDWLEKLDKEMGKKKRKIAMIVDNCPAHPKVKLQNVDLIYLPPNTTSKTQPMDQGVINNLKVQYRKRIVMKQIEAIDSKSEFKVSVLEALYLFQQAWECVTSKTIASCYKHAGFSQSNEETEEEDESDELDDIPLARLVRMGDPSILTNFISFNEEVTTSDKLTDEEIISDVLDARAKKDGDEEEEEEEEEDTSENSVPNCDNVMNSLYEVRKYFQSKVNSDNQLIVLSSLIREVTRDKLSEVASRKQSSMLDFFGPDVNRN